MMSSQHLILAEGRVDKVWHLCVLPLVFWLPLAEPPVHAAVPLYPTEVQGIGVSKHMPVPVAFHFLSYVVAEPSVDVTTPVRGNMFALSLRL